MPIKIKANSKLCRTCGIRKPKNLHHLEMNNTCLDCLGTQSPGEFRLDENKRKKLKQSNKINRILGGAELKAGYIYLLYSKEKDFYKVGVSVNPLSRLGTVSAEYGIADFSIICIGNPIGRSFDCEKYIHSKMSGYKVKYIKPCGGMANELFSCILPEIMNLFLSVCQTYYYLDDSTRDLLFCKIPKATNLEVSKMRLGRRIKKVKHDSVIVNKILRERRDFLKRKITGPFNLFKSMNYQAVKCYATGDRKDHRFECVYNKNISLGVYDCYREAKLIHREFKDFIRSEKKNLYRVLKRR